MKKTSRPVITGIVTAVVLLAALVSCSNLNIRKQASIVISFGNARATLSYQKSDASYYMISLQPEVQKPKRVEASQSTAEITGIEEGTYTLLVKAYDANDELIAEGRTEGIQVVIGETATATVQMEAKTYHVHEFATDWTTDATYHWHAATCGHDAVQDKAEHEWGEWIVTRQPSDNSDGEKQHTCTKCGYNETAPYYGPYTATYTFTETVKPAPEGYSGSMESAGGTGRYVIFGDFPQTVAETGVTFNPRPEENGYYVGSDGCYYEKVQVGSAYNSYYFNNRTMITQNTSHYIKVEPIVWRVLTTEYDWDGEGNEEPAALLLSEKTLTRAKFYLNGDSRQINGTTIYPNNYKYSTVRAYLNGRYEDGDTQEQTYTVDGKVRGFLQMAFSENAQNLVNFTTVNNAKETIGYDETSIQKREGFVCDDTIDRIFLLSDSEFVSSEYGFKGPTTADNARKLALTDYAKTFLNDYQFIWERSPNDKYNSACTANSSNSGYASGGSTINELFGVVPALTVQLPAQ